MPRPQLSLPHRLVSSAALLRFRRHLSGGSPPPSRPRRPLSLSGTSPDVTFAYFVPAGKLKTVRLGAHQGQEGHPLRGAGAFTPTCSQKDLSGFVEKASELKAKGVDTIACVSVNDAFVMRAWNETLDVGDEVLMLADGNGDFTRPRGGPRSPG
ncbi:putative Peroxiredoxin-2E, chloroplastic [Cocos nucifera]|uniref:glutaredoxin-dependent peroxiredoxin n=1 Tax=Cocos nucifera TaxID=13894 RepID=A0A8K0IW87_COCNU|nr:putative Peroxiredoxin-2E, chloroplastic [Cocos nucifera]